MLLNNEDIAARGCICLEEKNLVLRRGTGGIEMIKRLKNSKKTGEERFVGMDGSLSEYWSWAHSDIASNTERGRLAEYFVSKAVKAKAPCRVEWDEVDVISEEGIEIEVKTSAYLQTWRQNHFSSIQFDIAPKNTWDRKRNQFSAEKRRNAQVYVFCLFNCKSAENANVMDLNQWEFYVLGTSVLNEKAPKQKMIGLKSLLRIGAKKADFENLHNEVIASAKE